ncbi:hypothetical protein [Methyloglobulus sp.]|uniref:hypothetical protein n=1 Tax=Methyloglobulus sp. TaxID=2518622 RepID=UPI0032B87378
MAADCNQVDWYLEFLKVTPTLIVGIIAVIITYQQRNIAKAKLNLDLFERRLMIFNETWVVASSAIQSVEPIYAPPSFTNLYPEASFLFGGEVETYMKELAR